MIRMLRQGMLVKQLGGYRLYDGREMVDITPGGQSVTRGPGIVVTKPDGGEVYFGKGSIKALDDGLYWMGQWITGDAR